MAKTSKQLRSEQLQAKAHDGLPADQVVDAHQTTALPVVQLTIVNGRQHASNATNPTKITDCRMLHRAVCMPLHQMHLQGLLCGLAHSTRYRLLAQTLESLIPVATYSKTHC
jgi:hypothetical protein